jgi:Flp pilus assembly pilin Flp
MLSFGSGVVSIWLRLVHDRSGAAAEYALLVAVLLSAIVFGFQAFGEALLALFSGISAFLSNAVQS